MQASPRTSIIRSKSCEIKLNKDYEGENINNENDQYEVVKFSDAKKEDKISNDKDTKIIITSFAPEPKQRQRPSSQIVIDYQNDLEKNNNNSNIENLESNKNLNLLWLNGKTNLPIILFTPKVLKKIVWDCKKIGEQYRLTYKFLQGEKKLIKALLEGHGFRETHPNSSEFNLIWSGSNLKSYSFRSLQENQKVNHFPRSCELTRKDRLYKNIQRMQKEKGLKSFNFVPITFVMPFEIDDFYTTFYKEKGIWIVKPTSLSRGRGIYLINHPDQIPLDEGLVVSKYLSNPLLIDGFKFDLRLYVAVTSFDPLVIYLYEEGLTRFATIKYDSNIRNIKASCMHLTNYSVNKKNDKYVRCNDPNVEDYGNKWSMSAFLRYLKNLGKDTFSIMMNIEDVIIKTLISVESPMSSAARMFIPHRGNCFELYGFDILIDEHLKPWVLEVNLSPSLDCDAILDVKVKSNMICDLLSLSGINCCNPSSFSSKSRQFRDTIKNKNDIKFKVRPHSANITANTLKLRSSEKTNDPFYEGLSSNEQNVLKSVIDENERSNGFIRLFPASDTWEFYSQFLESRSSSFNMMVHKKLFPRRWQLNGNSPKKATQPRAKALETSYELYKEGKYNMAETTGPSLKDALDRYQRYERKLKDTFKPNDEILRKLAPSLNLQARSQKVNYFPIGDVSKRNREQTSLSDSTINGEELNTTLDSFKINKQNSNLNFSKKTLPVISPVNRTNSASSIITSSYASTDLNSHLFRKLPKTVLKNENEKNNENDELNYQSDNTENKYDLPFLLKCLENGYYLSRIQIRNAFALYLFKIQVRLVAESNTNDDSNLQQMDLVLRFIKKAAPNLSQEFKVFVPSRKLPLSEQKRMLAKQLHDFLHVYRKDTEQIRIELNNQIKKEKRTYKNNLIDEKMFQSLLYKCCESELEEIMSAYMKNSQDSSVFLGVSKVNNNFSEQIFDSKSPNQNANTNKLTNDIIVSKPPNNSSKVKNFDTCNKNNKPKNNPKTPELSGDELSNYSFDSRSSFSSLNSDNLIKSESTKKSNFKMVKSASSECKIYNKNLENNQNNKINHKNNELSKNDSNNDIKKKLNGLSYEKIITNIYLNGPSKTKEKVRFSSTSRPYTSLNDVHRSFSSTRKNLKNNTFENLKDKNSNTLYVSTCSNKDDKLVDIGLHLKSLDKRKKERVYSAAKLANYFQN